MSLLFLVLVLVCLGFWFLIDKIFNIYLKDSSSFSRSFYLGGIQVVPLDQSSHKRCSSNIRADNLLLCFLFNSHVSAWSLYRCGCYLAELAAFLLHKYFQEQISNLANILLLIVNLPDDTRAGCCQLRKLLIRGHICQFLELFNNIALLYV